MHILTPPRPTHSPSTHTHTQFFLSPRHPPTPHPSRLLSVKKSLLHFRLISPFSLVLTRGGPLYSPLHARSQRCDRSPSPCAGSPSSLLSYPLLSSLPAPAARLPNGSALLIYSSNHCCLPLLCTTSTSVPHLYNPTSLPVFSLPRSLTRPLFLLTLFLSLCLSFFLSVPSCTTLGEGRKKKPSARGRRRRREGKMEGWEEGGVGGKQGPLIFH